MSVRKSFFITFEGPDGSGKSTIIKMVAQHLSENNIEYVLTREPGGSKIAEEIRNVILDPKNTNLSASTEALLYAASRAQHFDEIIKPALDHDKIVLCDRFLDSSLVYQGIARKLGVKEVLEINRLDNEDIAFHQEVYRGYQEIIKTDKSRFMVVDASQSIDRVFKDTLACIEERYNG